MLMTVEDLCALPDDGLHYELVHGELVSEPPPGGGMAASPRDWYRGSARTPKLIGSASYCDTSAKVHAKVADYLAAGTPLVWIVDPEQRQVRSYRNLLQPQITIEPGELSADDLLPGLSLPVADIFKL